MAQPVPDNISFPDEEEKVLKLWKDIKAFETSLEQSKKKPKWVLVITTVSVYVSVVDPGVLRVALPSPLSCKNTLIKKMTAKGSHRFHISSPPPSPHRFTQSLPLALYFQFKGNNVRFKPCSHVTFFKKRPVFL